MFAMYLLPMANGLRYQDNQQELTKSNRGRKPDQLLTMLAIKNLGPEGKPFWKCITLKCTHKAKGNIQASRVLKHSVTCMALREYDCVAYDKANSAAVNGSLGSQIQKPETPTSTGNNVSTDMTSAATHGDRCMFMFSGDSLITRAGTLNPAPF